MSPIPPAREPTRDDEGSPRAGPGTPGANRKVLSLAELLARRETLRASGQRLVQCHGCFDIVHPGHIRHLRQAKSHGDVLLVSITGDSAYTKRDGAPLIPEELRAENLAELDCVDLVYIDESPSAIGLLQQTRPDVYIKGREYEHNNDPRFAAERRAVEAAGGRVVFSSGDVVFSSTALIAALERSADPYHARLSQLLAQPELDGPLLNSLVSAFRGKRVVIVGECISDVYVLCDQPEVASESPVMTLRPLERRVYDGGAAVIARHVAALGGKPTLVTGLPATREAQAMRQRLAAEGVDVAAVQIEGELAEKQRFLVGAQKVMKINALEPIVLDTARVDRLIDMAQELAREQGGADAAIIADFGNGLLSEGTIDRLIDAVRPHAGVLAGDVSGRRASLRAFKDMDLLCPSESEVREAYRCFDEGIPSVAWRLLSETRTRHAFVTLGADGLIAFEPLADAHADIAGGETDGFRSRVRGEHVPALCGHPVDPLGCGDALLATATLALASGAAPTAAAFLGSIAAASQAMRLGNVPIAATDLRHGIVRLHTARLTFSPAERRGIERVASA